MKQALQILMIFLSILIPTSVWGQGTIETNNKGKRGKVNPPIKSIKGEEEFKTAHEYYDNQEYETAFYWLQKAADLGHGVAQNDLALMYQYGIGTKANTDKALYWYKKAVASGYNGAAFHLKLINVLKSVLKEVLKDSDIEKYWPKFFSCWLQENDRIQAEFNPALFFENKKTALTRENKLLLDYIRAIIEEDAGNRNIIVTAYNDNYTGTDDEILKLEIQELRMYRII